MPKKKSRNEEPETISVKVATIGGEVKEFNLEEGATVEDALNAYGIDPDSSKKLRVDGEPVDLEDELEDGDYLTVSSKVKGGK